MAIMEATIPEWVSQFCHRWGKRVFPNDNISCHPSGEFEGGWDVVITRNNWEATLTLNPSVYSHPSMYPKSLLEADDYMRFALKSIKGKQKVAK